MGGWEGSKTESEENNSHTLFFTQMLREHNANTKHSFRIRLCIFLFWFTTGHCVHFATLFIHRIIYWPSTSNHWQTTHKRTKHSSRGSFFFAVIIIVQTIFCIVWLHVQFEPTALGLLLLIERNDLANYVIIRYCLHFCGAQSNLALFSHIGEGENTAFS